MGGEPVCQVVALAILATLTQLLWKDRVHDMVTRSVMTVTAIHRHWLDTFFDACVQTFSTALSNTFRSIARCPFIHAFFVVYRGDNTY